MVDDGSTDDTAAVVLGFGTAVRYLRQENAGPAAARNRGIREASSEWVAFLDADDVAYADRLERQLKALEQLPECDLLCGEVNLFQDQLPGSPTRQTEGTLKPLRFDQILCRNRVVTSTVLARRQAILDAGGFNTNYRGPEDFDLWLRLAARGHVWIMSEPLTAYRIVPDSLSQQVKTMLEQELAIIENARNDKDRATNPRLVRQAVAAAHLRAARGFSSAGFTREALQAVCHSLRIYRGRLTEYSRSTPLPRLRLLGSLVRRLIAPR